MSGQSDSFGRDSGGMAEERFHETFGSLYQMFEELRHENLRLRHECAQWAQEVSNLQTTQTTASNGGPELEKPCDAVCECWTSAALAAPASAPRRLQPDVNHGMQPQGRGSCVGKPSTLKDSLVEKVLRSFDPLKKVDVTRGTTLDLAKDLLKIHGVKDKERLSQLLQYTNTMACLAVIVSLLSFGISIDYFKDSPAWIAIEGVCTIIFLAELAIKINADENGCNGFFFKNKRDRAWNWIDTAVTTISCCDLLVSVTIGSRDHMFGKFSLLIRALRMIRMLHELSVLRRPFLKDLTHMLVGFLTGSPALVWVFILIWLVVGVLAMGLRLVIKVDDTEIDLVSQCVNSDRSFKADEEQCFGLMYKVVGQQYCNTVGECMFTVFRCLMGECSAYNGTSLVTVLSEHYGLRFNMVYAASMVLVMLGIFNVVTAVFVEATERGIAEDDTNYKMKHTYLPEFVEDKLLELCQVLYAEHWHGHRITINTSKSDLGFSTQVHDDKLEIHEVRPGNQNHLGFQIKNGDYIVEVNEITIAEQMQKLMLKKKRLDIVVRRKEEEPSKTLHTARWNLEEFKRVFQNPKVVAILDQLDIESDDASRQKLFHAFDLDTDGHVTIHELIETLVEMQGRVTMAHITAPILTLRQVVKRLKDIETQVSTTADTSGLPRPALVEVVDSVPLAANHCHHTATESKKKKKKPRLDATSAASEGASTSPR